MQLQHLVHTNNDSIQLKVIRQQCHQFLLESNSHPLYKSLPDQYGPLKRVKVRHKKHDPLDGVYEGIHHNIRLKTVFTSSAQPQLTEGHSLYYIFPLDGYKFLYSKEIRDSSGEIKTVLETLLEQYEPSQAVTLIQQVLKFSYTDVMLEDGIMAGSEIMLYNIPAYYAVRANEDYRSLLTKIGI